ncbi:MAG: Gfo/Idh/MocA family oxidoreductase [Kiritimatiellae bacterium]|nr:Gfo/Idh/MocA family oxidoreductase [Kiritimatiellia bacterium]
MTNRREFLQGTLWMGALAMAGGAFGGATVPTVGGKMATFAAPALRKVRVGCVGLGSRGSGAVHRLAMIPGVEITALCDIRPDAVKRQQDWLAAKKRPTPRAFVGEQAWKDLCQWDGVDVIYNTTPWQLHAPVALGALRGSKHAFTEVPAAMTLDECWELVETSEKMQRHCMMLENCCYGEIEMLAFNLCHRGILGELKHGEGAYIHDLRGSNLYGYWDHWRYKWNAAHKGNLYPTHGLGPICLDMDINRGDRFDYLVSLESQQAGLTTLAKFALPEDAWQRKTNVQTGDMNTTLIKTAKGRSIMVQHDVSSPRPYSRINLISGTRGMLCDYPYRLAIENRPGQGAHGFNDAVAAEYREKYKHPLWKRAGEIAKKVGGHGGMDFLMDLRWAYCLQNGLPLDMNVYDLASWCSLVELSEKSVKNRSNSVDVPDFTRGGWKTTKPLGLVDVDLARMGLSVGNVKKDNAQLNV